MPRYYFDIYDGEQSVADEDGMELDDIEASKREVRQVLASLARDVVRNGKHQSFTVNVRDEAGQIMLRGILSLVIEELTLNG
jgi:hypothetical protein